MSVTILEMVFRHDEHDEEDQLATTLHKRAPADGVRTLLACLDCLKGGGGRET